MNTGSSIITKRLTFHTQAYNKICECQGGFREGYSTLDNGFILKSINNKYLSMKGKSIYVAFVDFHKAFDSVDTYVVVFCMKFCIESV